MHGGHDLRAIGALRCAFERFVDERRGRQLRHARRIDDRVDGDVSRLVESGGESRILRAAAGASSDEQPSPCAATEVILGSETTIAEFGTP